MKTVKWQKIKWSDELAVEIIDIDADHKHLVRHMDALFTACHDGQGAEVLKKHLNALQHYTRVHFAHEEEIMDKNSFPGLEDHRTKHMELIAALEDLIEAFDLEPADTLPEKTLQFLQRWLLHHIMVEDKKIGHHMGAVY
jgi:hemerythrin